MNLTTGMVLSYPSLLHAVHYNLLLYSYEPQQTV